MTRGRPSGPPVVPLVLAGVLVTLAATASELAGQQGCDWIAPTRDLQTRTLGESTITRVQSPHLACRDGVRIRADSARFFDANQLFQFYGNVRFEHPDYSLRSVNAQYYRNQAQLLAQGDVELTRKVDGALITGQNLVYQEAGPQREEEELTVTGGRPHARLLIRPDTSARDEAADTTATAADTTGAAPDSLPSPGDSVRTDTTGVAADTTGVVADTTGAVPDSLAAGPDTSAAGRPDTLAADPSPEIPVGPPLPDPRGREGRRSPRDTAAVAYDVDADRIVLRGESSFRANGNVEIRRDSLTAYADGVTYDEEQGQMILVGNARMVTESYELAGDRIRALLPGQDLREVVSQNRAVLTGSDLRLRAPEIRIFLFDGALERLVATGDTAPPPLPEGEPQPDILEMEHPPRPVARTEDFLLWADSMEVVSPGEVLERLVAAGRARGESTARDSLNTEDTPPIARRDWIDGDTIVAMFERVPTPAGIPSAPDSVRDEYRLERLVARVNARSLYRLAPDSVTEAPGPTPVDSAAGAVTLPDSVVPPPDTAAVVMLPVPADSTAADSAGVAGRASAPSRPPLAIHYVMGDEITIIMAEGEVQRMEVVGRTRGVHLEPVRRRSGGAPPPTDAPGGGEP